MKKVYFLLCCLAGSLAMSALAKRPKRAKPCLTSVKNDRREGTIWLVPTDDLADKEVNKETLGRVKNVHEVKEKQARTVKGPWFFVYTVNSTIHDYKKHFKVTHRQRCKRKKHTVSFTDLENGWFNSRHFEVIDYIHGKPEAAKYEVGTVKPAAPAYIVQPGGFQEIIP